MSDANAPTVETLIADITAWWKRAVEQARQQKDPVSLARKVLSAMHGEDVDAVQFLWRQTIAQGNSYPACKGTVLDVSDARNEIHLPYRRLITALKTFIRLSEGHCLGMEELWIRYGMNPSEPLTKQACLQWIEGILREAPNIMQRAFELAARGEGLLPATKDTTAS